MNEQEPNRNNEQAPWVQEVYELAAVAAQLRLPDQPSATETSPSTEPNPAQGASISAEVQARDGPRIYVASLSDYNNGILHGRWIDAADEVESMQDEIILMLAASPTTRRYGDVAEEWAIHDYDGFGVLRLGEHESLDTVSRLGSGIITHGEAFAAWADHVRSDADELERFEECFFGEWESVEAFAESMIDEYGIMDEIEKVVPEHIRAYIEIDVESFARDLQYGGDIIAVDKPGGGVWVFGQ